MVTFFISFDASPDFLNRYLIASMTPLNLSLGWYVFPKVWRWYSKMRILRGLERRQAGESWKMKGEWMPENINKVSLPLTGLCFKNNPTLPQIPLEHALSLSEPSLMGLNGKHWQWLVAVNIFAVPEQPNLSNWAAKLRSEAIKHFLLRSHLNYEHKTCLWYNDKDI